MRWRACPARVRVASGSSLLGNVDRGASASSVAPYAHGVDSLDEQVMPVRVAERGCPQRRTCLGMCIPAQACTCGRTPNPAPSAPGQIMCGWSGRCDVRGVIMCGWSGFRTACRPDPAHTINDGSPELPDEPHMICPRRWPTDPWPSCTSPGSTPRLRFRRRGGRSGACVPASTAVSVRVPCLPATVESRRGCGWWSRYRHRRQWRAK